MARVESDLEQGIKRRPSSRDQLLARSVKDASGCIVFLFKEAFLRCTGLFAHHRESERQGTRDHAGSEVSQVMPRPLDPQPVDFRAYNSNSQRHSELPEYLSCQRSSANPAITADIHVGNAIRTPADRHVSREDHPVAQPPALSLHENQEAQAENTAEPLYSPVILQQDNQETYTEKTVEPPAEPQPRKQVIQDIFSGNGVTLIPLQPEIELPPGYSERSIPGIEASGRHVLEHEMSSRTSNNPRSNDGSIAYTVPGAWPRSTPGSAR